ncbi:transferase [Leptolyngbya sp. FACHB-261]|nr:transferase [Leptolyngbya sp. FACHB-261]
MPLRPLQLPSDPRSYISGDVTVDPSVGIAPGVMIQAAPNSRIVIAAGVCIGMGSVLHAREGTLVIEAGATLGAGVLVVGQSKIGANACIGSATTIINSSVAAGEVVPPGSLIGDTSRQLKVIAPVANGVVAAEVIADKGASASQPSESQPLEQLEQKDSEPEDADSSDSSDNSDSSLNGTGPAPTPAPKPNSDPEKTPSAPEGAPARKVYGEDHVNRILGKIFTHRQITSHTTKDNESS